MDAEPPLCGSFIVQKVFYFITLLPYVENPEKISKSLFLIQDRQYSLLFSFFLCGGIGFVGHFLFYCFWDLTCQKLSHYSKLDWLKLNSTCLNWGEKTGQIQSSFMDWISAPICALGMIILCNEQPAQLDKTTLTQHLRSEP